MNFPKDFVWGAAAAAYQIEGGFEADGKGLSVWDMHCRKPGVVWQNQSGEVACDHYHRYREDAGLMGQIGLQAYRLSVSWPRVLPMGTGSVNKAGLDFYDHLVDELLLQGIDPWVTLFHWDFPHDLFLRGGWLNPDSPKWFSDYTAIVVDRLSDRVSNWMTLNEPQCFIGLGHLNGEHAPGLKLSLHDTLLAGHHSLLAHGMAVQTIRSRARITPSVGWAPVGYVCHPMSDSPEDVEAARQATMDVHPGSVWNNRWWGDPPVLGHYPEKGLQVYGKAVPKFKSSDFEIIRQPLDFYGCNIYSGVPTKAGPDGKPIHPPVTQGHPHTPMLWNSTPEALRWGPHFLADAYRLPIVVTENGLANCDWVSLDGKVHDAARIDFLNRYLIELGKAIEDGVDVRGYFVWSIMDNFEWQEGYKHRFGLVHVDYGTQQRTVKDSGHWYREVIQSNGRILSRHALPESLPDFPEVVANGAVPLVAEA